MTRHGHIAWSVIAAAAFAGTAALAVMLTRAPVRGHAALSSDLGLSTCSASGLQARLGLVPSNLPRAGDAVGPGARAAGSTFYTLEFTNVSARPCDLYGYPDVSAYSASQPAGVQIGAAASYDTTVRPRPVVLAPGGTAHSVLQVAGAWTLRRDACRQVTARELRVTLPDEGRAAFVPVRFAACAKKGLTFMRVQPVQARAGVPGYAMP